MEDTDYYELRDRLIKTESRLEYIKKEVIRLDTAYSNIFEYFNNKFPEEMSVYVESL